MALQLESRIMWGTGLENVLAFEYPTALDNKHHWRRPAPGSERARNAAGTTDAWVTGYDYMLAGRARWFTDALWSGGPGIQEFLDWAGQGNVFRFVPDKNAPDFYVDNVTLDEPFDDPAPDLEQADGSQALDLVLRNPTVDFGQALRGIMFEYAPGMSLSDPVAATFTRATAATRRGLPSTNMAAGIGASDVSGTLRDRHYEGSLRTTLLEAARTQLVTNPENFGAWSVDGTPVLTSGQVDPFGGTAAYLVNDDDAGTIEDLRQVVTFTADGEKCIGIFVKQGTGTQPWFGIFDSTATVWRHQVRITWSGGIPSLTSIGGSGTRFTPVNWGGGWWLCDISVIGVVAANTNSFYFSPADNAAAGVGTTYFFGANAWNAIFPSSYQGPSLGTRNADQFSWPFTHKPQAMFALVEFVERGTAKLTGNNARLHYIGTGDFVDGSILSNIETGSQRYRAYHRTIAGVSLSSEPAHAALSVGDSVAFLHLLNADGSVQGKISINAAAEVVGALSAVGALPAAWSGTTLALNSSANGSSTGFNAYARLKIGPLTFGGVTRDTIAKARSA